MMKPMPKAQVTQSKKFNHMMTPGYPIKKFKSHDDTDTKGTSYLIKVFKSHDDTDAKGTGYLLVREKKQRKGGKTRCPT